MLTIRRMLGVRSKSERGQVLILTVGIFTVFLLLGAFAIDQGVWYAKRRESQKDADTAARGGAMALLQNLNAASAAEDEARRVADQNLVPDNENTTFQYETNCETFDPGITYAGVPAVHAEVNRPTSSLFGRIFGIDGLQDLGAQATACVGNPSRLTGIDPFYIAPSADRPEPECFDAQGNPRLGSICAIMGPSHFHEYGQRGTITLQDDPENIGNNETECTQPSNTAIRDQVVGGSGAICEVGDEVHTDGGTFNNVDAAVRCRILGYATGSGSTNPDGRGAGNNCPNGYRSFAKAPGEGFCDRDFRVNGSTVPPFNGSGLSPAFAPGDIISSPNGMDDFAEAFTNPATGGPPTSYSGPAFLVPNLCDGRMSPRIVTIVLAEDAAGRQGDLEPCVEITSQGCVRVEQFAMFFIVGCRDVDGPGSFNFTGQIDPFCNNINAARTALVGVFVKAFIPEGGGPLTRCDQGGIIGCSIVLVK